MAQQRLCSAIVLLFVPSLSWVNDRTNEISSHNLRWRLVFGIPAGRVDALTFKSTWKIHFINEQGLDEAGIDENGLFR
jgi:hypothetical protein